MNYRFRRAQPADVDSIIDIIQERIDWMDRQGPLPVNKTHICSATHGNIFCSG